MKVDSYDNPAKRTRQYIAMLEAQLLDLCGMAIRDRRHLTEAAQIASILTALRGG